MPEFLPIYVVLIGYTAKLKASGQKEKLDMPHTKIKHKWEQETDVIGSGLAGLAATIEAANRFVLSWYWKR